MPKCVIFSTGSGFRCLAATAALAIAALLQGCGGGSPSSTKTTATKTLSSIAVTPATASVAGTATQQFKATGTYSDSSTQDLTSTATWSSSSTSVATVNSSGLATGVAAGSSTITATSGSVSGTAALTVTAALVSIAVTPANPSVLVSGTEQFKATGTYSDSSTQDITSTATWSSSSTPVATINATGLATGVGAGSTTITAASGSISGTTTLMVSAPGGSTSGSTAILVIPAPAGSSIKPRGRKSPANSSGTGFIDGAYQPQSQIPNATTGQYSVQVVNLDTGTSTSALVASIPMPLKDSLGNVYLPNATGGSQSLLKVVVISYSSPDVQVIDASTNTLTATYTSPVTQTVTFSGGTCTICGVLINTGASSNQVLLDTAQGYYTMDLGTGSFTALATAYPSENFAFDPTSQLILSPTYSEDGTPTEVQILDLTTGSVTTNAGLNISVPDSAAIDLNTNVGVVVDEEGGGQTLVNLSQIATSSGNWTAPSTLYTIPLSGNEMTYITIDSTSHTLFTSQEFGNLTAIELLPSSTSTGAPAAPTGYVWATMPNTPDGNGYANGGDPHAVSIFTSVVDGKLYGFLVEDQQNWVAKIDLAAALAATQIANPPYPGEIDLTPFTTYLPTTQ
jgi:trimeric autotransporter adhesin